MRVLITDRFSAAGVAVLNDAALEVIDRPGITGDELFAAVADVEAILIRSQTKIDITLLEHAKKLLVVGRAGVGYENIDIPACTSRGVAVMNTPGASAITTAERTIAMMMAMIHQIPAADRSMRAGKWDRRSWLARECYDKTLGILGYGNVGRVVADRALALQMRVITHDPNVPPETAFNVGVKPVGFDELLAEADIVSCHVSADARLTGLIGRREIARMKKGAFLLNTSRGFVVEEAALVEALDAKHLAGAALDVFETEPLPATSRLREFDNVVLSPHLGASTVEAEARVSLATARQVARFLREGKASNLVARPASFRHALANAQ